MAQRKKGKRRLWNYPRRGKGKIMRWFPSWRFVFGSIFLLIATGAGIFTYLYTTTDIPEPGDFALAQSTTVSYADGESSLGSFSEVRRTSVPLETLPDYVPHAVVASEDQRFYENPGIDVIGLARAAINNVTGGARQGGSTLTQQYVERYYVGTTTDIPGKLRELVLALKIDQEQSKDEILENYLNTIYFGRGSYGIEEASQAYFGIPASELSLEQAALLVAVIPSPSAWDPAVNEDKARQRWERVLNRMLQDGWITTDDLRTVTFPETVEPTQLNIYEGPNGYLLQTAREELIASGEFTAEEIDTAGLHIVLTIDEDMQAAAVDAVNLLPDDRPTNNHVGLVSVDPSNGEIKALYGGADYLQRQRNAVTQDRAQAGSTAKPFALVAAMEQGIPLTARYRSDSPMVIGGTEFVNYQGYGLGNISLIQATAQSVNTSFVLLNEEVGPEGTRDVMVRAGIPEDTPGLENNLANVLGPYSPRPIDQVRAFSTFAAQGERTTPHIVREVRDRDGNVIYRGNTLSERVFDSDDMANLTYALQQPVSAGGTAPQISALGRPVAGKTGSSSYYMSAWFAGYIPQLVTVVDMYQVGADGNEEPLTGFGGVELVAGGTFPAQVWLDYMMVVTEGMEIEDFPAPVATSAPPAPAPEPEPTEEESTTEEPTEEETTTEEPTTEPPASDPTSEEPDDPTPSTEQPTSASPSGPSDDPSSDPSGSGETTSP